MADLSPLSPALRDRLTLYRDREDWLAARRGTDDVPYRIGGSTVAKIQGLSSWGGPWDVYREHVLGHVPEYDEDTLRTFARGHAAEPMALRLYQHDTGAESLLEHGEIAHLHDPDAPWRAGSPDGLVLRDGEPGGLEIKALFHADSLTRELADQIRAQGDVTIERWEPGAEKLLPPVVAVQVLWYLSLCDLPWWDVVFLLPWYDIRTVRLCRDEDTQAALVQAVSTWRQRHLVEGHEPPVDHTDACRDAVRREPDKGRDWRLATDDEAQWVQQYRTARRDRQDAERRRKQARAALIQSMGDDPAIRCSPDGPRITHNGTQVHVP